MQTRRLQMLAELARLGSMRDVADTLGTTTSTVSQQVAALANEVGVALLEPDGRRVRLTPAGQRLAEHAVHILAAVEAARVDLNPRAEPIGTVRIAGFATAIRRLLLPVVADLAGSHPQVRVLIAEHEPADATELLASDQVDLALTYDFNLAPAASGSTIAPTLLWTTPWGLGVPAAHPGAGVTGDTLGVFSRFRTAAWIVNSRNTADEQVIRTLASMAGFQPRIVHQADSLELVQDLITAGLGVGLLPAGHTLLPTVGLLPLQQPAVTMRAYAQIRHGRVQWPPLQLVLDQMITASTSASVPL